MTAKIVEMKEAIEIVKRMRIYPHSLLPISIVATSGGFDPIHIGHVRCLKDSASVVESAFLVVILNGDGFLTRKKGRSFMKFEERAEILASIRYVDLVVGWDDGSQTVCGALEALRPDIFTKGGDRSARGVVPEADVCDRIGCRIEYGVGGVEKVQSSSDLIKSAV
jgi:cytidyltransferase-like protein